MIIIGIDPGISGAISILENKKILEVYDTPTMIEGKKNKRQINSAHVTNIIKERLSNEKEVRILAWWRSNDKFRYLLKDETDEEVFADSSRQLNLEETLCLMGSGNAIESLMKAELFRQLKRFDEAIEMVSSINDWETLNAKTRKIKILADRSDYMVRRFD